MSDTQEDIYYSLTKPLKTLPSDASLPNITVPSDSAAKGEVPSKLTTEDVQPEIQKGLATARRMADEAVKAAPQKPGQSGGQQSTQPARQTQKPSEPKPSSEVPEGYAQNVATGEGGSADAKNPNSSAAGWHQFLNSTWMEQVRKNRPDLLEGRTEAQVLALRGNKEISSELAVDYAKENAGILRAAGQPVTGGNLYLAHFLGGRGAANMLSAPGDDPAALHMSDEAVKANPWVKGMTVDQLKRTMEIKANGGRVTSNGNGTDDPSTRGKPITSDPQYQEIVKRLLELHPAAPGLSFSNGGHQTQAKEESPWVSAFLEFAQYAAAILAASAAVGSKRGKMASIGAMGAMANAINGVTQGNQEKYKLGIEKFEAETKRMAEQNAWEAKQYQMIHEQYKDDQAGLIAALRAKTLELQDERMNATLRQGDARLAEEIAQHKAQNARMEEQIAQKGEPLYMDPGKGEYFTWFREFKEQNGRDPSSQEIRQHNLEVAKEKKEATSTQRTDPRSAFFKTWHDKFVEDNGREPTSEEWGQQESKWKEASAAARSLSPAQQEQQRQITAAQSALQQLNDGKDVKLPGGQVLTSKEWNEFQNLPAGSPMTPKQQQVMVPLLRLANKRLEDQPTSSGGETLEGPKGDSWSPPEGAVQGTPEQLGRFQDGDLAVTNGKYYRVDKQHGYFIPDEPVQNPSPG